MNIDIRLSLEFFDHPKTKKLKKRLGLEGVMALIKLWAWTAGNRPGGVLTGLDAEAVELAADWDGEEGAFVATLLNLSLLDDSDGTFAIHDWEDHQAYASKSEERSRRGAAGAAGKWKQDRDEQNRMTRSERLSAARKKGTHTSEEWQEMVHFFGGRCVRCGADDVAPVKDHIVPIYQGGCDSIRNLQPLCRHCNSSKGPENIDYRGDFCLRERLEMPTKWDKNACERLQDACDVCVTSGRTPAPETRNQEPETRSIKTHPLPLASEGEECVLPETRSPDSPDKPSGSRKDGTNPRAERTNPRARGTNPRATGTNPRACGDTGSQTMPDSWQDTATEPDGPAKTDAPSRGHPQWPAFLSCFGVYPVQQGQEAAWREWMRLHGNGTLAPAFVIREAILRLTAEDSRWKRGMAPNMAKWLNGKGWNDEPYMPPGAADSMAQPTVDEINAQAERAAEERRKSFAALRAQSERMRYGGLADGGVQ